MKPPVEPSESKLASQSKDFRKVVFTLTEQNFQKGSPVLIWYIGDKDAVERVPYEKSKIDRHFLPTIASHREEIKAEVRTNGSNKEVFVNLKKTFLSIDRKFVYLESWMIL